MAGTEPGQDWESGTQSLSTMWVAKAQLFEPLFSASQGGINRKLQVKGRARTESQAFSHGMWMSFLTAYVLG